MDQLRADCVTGAIGATLQLPNLRSLMNEGVTFAKHFSVATPCGPSRASMFTGRYAMNHRSVRNGAPLDSRHTNIALELRAVGYDPLLFGYTDTSLDPRDRSLNDPELKTYEGVMPGFREILRFRYSANEAWQGHLRRNGYNVPVAKEDLYRPVRSDGRPSTDICDPAWFRKEDSETAVLTDKTIEFLESFSTPGWFAHVAYIRPHPPLVAPAPYSRMYRPEDLPDPVRPSSIDEQIAQHSFFQAYFAEPSNHSLFAGFDGCMDKLDLARSKALRAVYCGLITELDTQIGRLIDFLKVSGQLDNTLVIVTSDHGELLGDHYMWGKEAVYDPAFHVPLFIRDPKRRDAAGSVVDKLTESIDLAPTVAEWAGAPVFGGFDGRSLIPWLAGQEPSVWRTHVFSEIDLANPVSPTRYQRQLGLKLSEANLAILRTDRFKLVYFNGGLPPLLFQLDDDPGELVNVAGDPAYSQTLQSLMALMLDHRMSYADQTLSRSALTPDGVKTADPDS